MRGMFGVFVLSASACAGAPSHFPDGIDCQVVASKQVSDLSVAPYGMEVSPATLIGKLGSPVSFAVTSAATGGSASQATLTLTVDGAATARDLGDSDHPERCTDDVEVPFHVTLISDDGVLHEGFDVTIRLDAGLDVHESVRVGADHVGGTIDPASALAGSSTAFDEIDLGVGLLHTSDGVWSGSLSAIGVVNKAPSTPGCPNTDPNADVDCPTTTETMVPMYTLTAAD